MSTPTATQINAFYAAAHQGLGLLVRDSRIDSHFDADADAAWRLGRGHLTEVDRLDLAIADVAVTWPLAFAPTQIFDMEGIADDEAFPPRWPGADANAAVRMVLGLPEVTDTPAAAAVLSAITTGWHVHPVPFAPELDTIGPGTTVVVGGAGALDAVIRYMADSPGLDIGRQVVLVTRDPALRQWLGLAAAVTGNRDTPRVIGPALAGTEAKRTEVSSAVALASPDAPAEVVMVLRQLGASC